MHGDGNDLWLDEDQMPSCPQCLKGQHRACMDLMWSDKYGMFACGCTNAYHEE